MRSFRGVLGLVCCATALVAQTPQWEYLGGYPLPPNAKTPLWIAFGPRESDPQPMSTAYILCGGVDANFNGVQDSGDVPPALVMGWTEAGGTGFLGISLPWGPLSFPLRTIALFDSGRTRVYLPRIDRLTVFSIPIGERLEDTLLTVGVQAVARIGDTLLLTCRTGADSGEIWFLMPDGSRDTIVVRGCPNIQQLLWDARRGQLIVLCEGVFGQQNASVHFVPLGNPDRSTQVPVGDTGNFLLLEGDTLIVVANGSHELYLLDPATHSAVRQPIGVGTSGYGGPREALLLTLPNGQRTALVSTYSRDIRWIDLSSGSVLQILPLSGLAEGMALRRFGDTLELWVTQPFTPTYAADSTIALFRLVVPSSVPEAAMETGPRVTPSIVREGPALVSWKLPAGSTARVWAELYDLQGRQWGRWEFAVSAAGELVAVLPVSRTQLTPGWYCVRLSAGEHRAVLPLLVQ